VAKLLGESEFTVLFHQGKDQSIHVSLVGERSLVVTVFASSVKAGMIQVLGKELAVQLGGILAEASARPAQDPATEGVGLGNQFSEEMKQQLDSLFADL
jgi:hypothetical protein